MNSRKWLDCSITRYQNWKLKTTIIIIMSQELLQRIVENTTPTKTNLISLVTKIPEFSIEFNPPLAASEIALTQLRCYYSWPNVRSEPFNDKPPNNSFTFSYNNKVKPDGTPDTTT